MKISKELFIETINFIKERNDAQEKLDKIFKEEFTQNSFWPYCRYETQMVKILTEVTNSKENDWISWWCWEKNFGRDDNLTAYNSDGTEIPLKTAEDLWNLLESEYNEDPSLY